MATITRTPSKTWKAVIRKRGWPTTSKTFRTKRDATDWARRTEDDMVRGVYINRADADRLTLEKALERYLKEITPTKRPSTQIPEKQKAKVLSEKLGKYSLGAITPDIVAQYRDGRLEDDKAADTVRLELSLLSNLFTIAICVDQRSLPLIPREACHPNRGNAATASERSDAGFSFYSFSLVAVN